MLKLCTIIVDDEPLARQRLRRLLQADQDVEVVAEAGSGREAIAEISKFQPDLVFLDVQMPEIDGFQVLKSLETIPHIIFATAFDQYAIRAFEVNALDYLIKPISTERLGLALERVKQRVSSPPLRQELLRDFQTLLKESRKKYLSRIPGQRRNEILLVDVDSIYSLEMDTGILRAYLENGSVATHYTLNEIEELLDPQIFFKANRSALMNLSKVEKLTRWFGNRILAKLRNGREVEVSRLQTRKLKDLLRL